ncbi:MAG TPA: S41 family peptidase [Gemmatimonadaceae bacterium]|nr:S41 family peptidase [Gemmatimonadaceae bacterium]
MPSLRKKLLIGSLVLPLLAGGFVIQSTEARDGARLFDQVLSLVADRFVDTVTTATLYEKAARGLVEELNDPYSELLTPKQLQRFSTTSTGRYGGVGMQIENQEGSITVVKVFPNTPAEAAGVVEGDRIVAVDTASTRGWSTERVSEALLGTPGTKVNVTFGRPGVQQPIQHRLTRAQIHIPAVPYALLLDGNIGYVPLQTFNESASQEVRDAVTRLQRQGARSFILDIRQNPGGILDQGLAVADLFLKRGQEIASVRGRKGPAETYVSRAGQHIPDVPLVVLINGYSASASEIVAGALQDHDRGLVLGTTSYGKGLVQTLFPLEGGYALKMTTAKWYTPSGRSIQKDRVADTSDVNGNDEEEQLPDSLETEHVKRDRPAFRSDAGRIVYGGGGITPDMIIPEDTATTREQEFAKIIAPKAGTVRSVMYTYALELKGQVTQGFTPRPEWREEFYRRLTAAGVTVDKALYDAAAPMVDRWLSNQTARFAFGDSSAFRRTIPEDPQITRAVELLNKGQTQQDLFALAQATPVTGRRPNHQR